MRSGTRCVATPDRDSRCGREHAHFRSRLVNARAGLVRFVGFEYYSLVKFWYVKWGISLLTQTD